MIPTPLRFVLLAAAINLGVSLDALAHSLGQSYLYLIVTESSLTVRFELAVADVNQALGLDLPTDGTLAGADLEPHAARLAAYLAGRTGVAPDGTPVTLDFVEHTIRDTKARQYVLSTFVVEGLARPPDYIDFDYGVLLDEIPDHAGVLVIENDWRSHTFANEGAISLIFKSATRSQRLDMTGSSLLTGLWGMVVLGMQHIIEGTDHVMFLVALLLPAVLRREAGRWQPEPRFRTALWQVFKIVTMFTIAHSITLSLAALGILEVSPRIVESVIAASIAVAALDIFVPVIGSRVVLVVFLFGLFHGAGFASVILSMDIHPDYTVLTLLGFNVGVELGQLAIVCVVFPLLFAIRAHTAYLRFGVQATAALLIAVATYWFVERAFEIDLPAGEYAQRILAAVTGA